VNDRWPGIEFSPDRMLRVGVVSGDFRTCSTPYLALPFFENRPGDWQLVLYAGIAREDEFSARFRSLADDWVDIVRMTDDEAAARILTDSIDVLIDLNGHTREGRPGVFARKPAPLQVAWLDYVGTTGLSTIDAIIGDPGHLPLDDQPDYTERIVHVRDNLYRYAPPPDMPETAESPFERAGAITFGCFNSLHKLTSRTFRIWSRVLAALPDSRLVLNAKDFRLEDVRRRFERLLGEHGIPADRCELRTGESGARELMAHYDDVDIALDPVPYSGGLTTLESLYMGVPVITCRGDRFGARHSSVHLTCLGLEDWIASDEDEYVALAVGKAADRAALAELRSGLRARMVASPMMDGAALAHDIGGIVRELWRETCSRRQ
jgi:predicted O-linked N-acetylglucosamine transferase (SPINDLY family)